MHAHVGKPVSSQRDERETSNRRPNRIPPGYHPFPQHPPNKPHRTAPAKIGQAGVGRCAAGMDPQHAQRDNQSHLGGAGKVGGVAFLARTPFGWCREFALHHPGGLRERTQSEAGQRGQHHEGVLWQTHRGRRALSRVNMGGRSVRRARGGVSSPCTPPLPCSEDRPGRQRPDLFRIHC